MPRLETFTLKIKTGQSGRDDVPKYSINGFPLEFDEIQGSAEAGELLELTGHPESFPHTLTLAGPEEGTWEIERIEAEYHCTDESPYKITLGAVTLDDHSDLNVWQERPAEVFDV